VDRENAQSKDEVDQHTYTIIMKVLQRASERIYFFKRQLDTADLWAVTHTNTRARPEQAWRQTEEAQ